MFLQALKCWLSRAVISLAEYIKFYIFKNRNFAEIIWHWISGFTHHRNFVFLAVLPSPPANMTGKKILCIGLLQMLQEIEP